jgi:hypothetical protein
MKLKFQQWIWRSLCILILAKKIEKWNLQAPWGMEDFTLLSIGARFKKWKCCTSILPKCPSPNILITSKKKKKKKEIGWTNWQGRYQLARLPPTATSPGPLVARQGRLATSSRPPFLAACPKFPLCKINFLSHAYIFLYMWSILASWLQHMPALPRFLLKFSNIHNLWSVGQKIMKFVLLRSLLWDACSQKVSKNLKIKWGQVTLPKTGLVTPCTFSPLGVKWENV